jgi:hypothetical protein
MPMCILEGEKEHIWSIWSWVIRLALPLAAAQSLARSGTSNTKK